MKKLICTLLVIGVLLTAAGGVLAGSASYVATDLGNIIGRAINDKGQIVGRYNSYEAVFRDSDGTERIVPSKTGQNFYLWLNDINEAGDAVGMDVVDPCKWNRATGTQWLYHDSYHKASPEAVNDYGVSVGWYDAGTEQYAVLWNADGTRTFLSTGGYGRAVDINNSGQVVGSAGGMNFLWTEKSGPTSLGTLNPTAISNNGVVVGNIWDSQTLACKWTASGGREALPMLPGGTNSVADDVNDLGQIVGYITTGSIPKAVIWNPDGSIIELGSGIGSYANLRINNKGQVLYGSTLYTPVPEPSSLMGLVSGFGAMAGIFAFRRRSK